RPARGSASDAAAPIAASENVLRVMWVLVILASLSDAVCQTIHGADADATRRFGNSVPRSRADVLARLPHRQRLKMRDHLVETHHVGIFVVHVEQIDLVREQAAVEAAFLD